MSKAERILEESEITALIYKVANELQGFKTPDEDAQLIINKISDLRTKGLLNEAQKKILDAIGEIKSIDYDGF